MTTTQTTNQTTTQTTTQFVALIPTRPSSL